MLDGEFIVGCYEFDGWDGIGLVGVGDLDGCGLVVIGVEGWVVGDYMIWVCLEVGWRVRGLMKDRGECDVFRSIEGRDEFMCNWCYVIWIDLIYSRFLFKGF